MPGGAGGCAPGGRGDAQFEEQLEPQGARPQRHAHMHGNEQFAYNQRIAEVCGVPPFPKW